LATDSSAVSDYQSARNGTSLFLFLATGCVGAPIVEEFAVRGFAYRGWSDSFLGPAGAILLTSALWAAAHTQYDWFGRFAIFVTGLLLGYFRYRSGSTYLAVVVHSAINLCFFVWLGLALQSA
jgi:membrane protease YdiL (CAAX protease family)